MDVLNFPVITTFTLKSASSALIVSSHTCDLHQGTNPIPLACRVQALKPQKSSLRSAPGFLLKPVSLQIGAKAVCAVWTAVCFAPEPYSKTRRWATWQFRSFCCGEFELRLQLCSKRGIQMVSSPFFFFHSICTRTILVRTFYSSFKFAGISLRDLKVIHGVNGTRSYREEKSEGKAQTFESRKTYFHRKWVKKMHMKVQMKHPLYFFSTCTHKSLVLLWPWTSHFSTAKEFSQSGKVLLSFLSPSGFFSVCFKCKVGACSYYVFFRIWYNATLILVSASKYYTDLIITWN